MPFNQADLDRIERMIEQNERRIAEQENRLEQLYASGRPTDETEAFLAIMLEMRALQIRIRHDVERLIEAKKCLEAELQGQHDGGHRLRPPRIGGSS